MKMHTPRDRHKLKIIKGEARGYETIVRSRKLYTRKTKHRSRMMQDM